MAALFTVFALLLQARDSAAVPRDELIALQASDWRFNDRASVGQLDDVAWGANDYDDHAPGAGWRDGAALIGSGPPGRYDGPGSPFQGGINGFQTPLDLTEGHVTYYFRKRFEFFNFTPEGVVLVVTNHLRDGAVYYLNGVEVGRIRMPAAPEPIRSDTPATGTAGSGAGPEVFLICEPTLLFGDNVLAVEVHRMGPASPDPAFALSLHVAPPGLPKLGASEPADRIVVAGRPTTLSVDPEDSLPPIGYQWFFDSEGSSGVSQITGATNATLVIPAMTAAQAGHYHCRVQNCFGAVATREAQVSYTPEPLRLQARIDPANPDELQLTLNTLVPGWKLNLQASAGGGAGAGAWVPVLPGPLTGTDLTIPRPTNGVVYFRIRADVADPR